MSRSIRALAETQRRGGSVHAVGEQRRLECRLRLERRLLPSAVSATKYAVMVLATGMLVMAVEPARALATSAQGAPMTNSSMPNAGPSNPVVLAYGSGYAGGTEAVRVRALQRRLDAAGYSPGPTDGRFGPRTEQAVDLFQSAHGLRVDGIAGPLTLSALRARPNALFPGAGYAGAGAGEVRALQRRLRRDGSSPGPIDGRYGPRTERAVTRFQAAHGLKVDGIAGPQTFRELARIATSQRHARGSTARSRPTAASRPRTQSRWTTQPRPGQRVRPTRSHPATPHAARPPAAATPAGQTNRPGIGHGGPSWPELLMLAGLVALAAFASGAWLVDRRRRKLMIAAPEPSDVEVAPVTVGGVKAGTELARPAAESSGATESNAVAESNGPAESNGGTESNDVAGSKGSTEPGHATGLGLRLEERGDVAAAELVYSYADQRGDAAAASNLGVLLERRGDMAGAEGAYRRSAARGNADGAFNLAGLLLGRGDVDGAMAAYGRADQLGDARAAANLALLLLEQGDAAEAKAAYRRADERGDGAAASNLGVLLERDGDSPAAEAAYRRADSRGDATGAFNLGGLLAERGDLEGAAAAYHRADQRGDPGAASNLGMLLEQDGDLSGAARAYRRAMERGHPTAAFNLGVLLERQDDHRGALRAFERAQASEDREIAETARARAVALIGAEESQR
jgi:peptidoglycan hydrolase-like protein with peptidoglycan-binding domain/Flp pilus assembly protein TadD